MADMDQGCNHSEAGPSRSQASRHSQTPQPQPPSQSAPKPSSTSTPNPTSPLSRSRSASRSPTSHRLGSKRQSIFSPVPEEESPLLLTSSSARQRDSEPSSSKRPRTTTRAPRTSATADPDRRRGARLFNLLTSTLTQFKRESESTQAAIAAQKRADIQARSANKLRESQNTIHQSQRKRALLWDARVIAEQIATADAQRKTLRRMKRRMASFLYSPIPINDCSETSTTRAERWGKGQNVERLAQDIPSSLAPMSNKVDDREADYAVYFLPGKTLPEQEDELNSQEDKVDDEIDAFDDAWEDSRRVLVERLEAIKGKIREI